MIRKSLKRFSEEIMLKQKPEAATIHPDLIALLVLAARPLGRRLIPQTARTNPGRGPDRVKPAALQGAS